MKKIQRVKRAEEFQSLIEKRNSDLNAQFVIYHQSKLEEKSRVGISVGKKMGNAVFRNKTKRQMRMMLQEVLKKDYSFDSIVIVRHKFFKQTYEENLKSLNKLYKTIEKRRYSNEAI